MLSDRDRMLLADIERHLDTDDPRLVGTFDAPRIRRHARRWPYLVAISIALLLLTGSMMMQLPFLSLGLAVAIVVACLQLAPTDEGRGPVRSGQPDHGDRGYRST